MNHYKVSRFVDPALDSFALTLCGEKDFECEGELRYIPPCKFNGGVDPECRDTEVDCPKCQAIYKALAHLDDTARSAVLGVVSFAQAMESVANSPNNSDWANLRLWVQQHARNSIGPAERILHPNDPCQHMLKEEKEKCEHGFYFGTTCDKCIEDCPTCARMYRR